MVALQENRVSIAGNACKISLQCAGIVAEKNGTNALDATGDQNLAECTVAGRIKRMSAALVVRSAVGSRARAAASVKRFMDLLLFLSSCSNVCGSVLAQTPLLAFKSGKFSGHWRRKKPSALALGG
jgi:hypothetical protein